MKIAVSNPSVGPHVQQNVMAYQETGYLDHFYTSFYEHPDSRFSSLLKKFKSLEKEISRRSFHQLSVEKFVSRPIPELLRSISARKAHPLITDAIWEWFELGFDRWVKRKVSTQYISAVHTYEHAALATLQWAKRAGVFSIYEQPSQHHAFFNRIAQEQTDLFPELKTRASALLVNEKAQRRNQRRDNEAHLADMILCNSAFTKRTLVSGNITADKISVLPLAFPPVIELKDKNMAKKPVIFLYAGNQSLRKATHLLYEAWRRCAFSESEAELWVIGKMMLPEAMMRGLPGKVVIKDNIPHVELLSVYKEADVFVFPTLADGFGMVVTEAMSQGLPVIASENSCGPDIIEHGTNGWLIKPGSVDMLVNQLQSAVTHSESLPTMSRAARHKATTWQWPEYRKALSNLVYDKWQRFSEEKKSV